MSSNAVSSPFDVKTIGCVALESSDGKQFFANPFILGTASPVLSSILTTTNESKLVKTIDWVPTVVVPEMDKEALDFFLRLLYPIRNPEVSDVSTVLQVFKAGKTYQAGFIEQQITPIISRFLADNAPRVYASACDLNFEDGARLAAQYMLKSRADAKADFNYVPEMEMVSAGAYFRLLWYINCSGDVCKDFKFVHRDLRDGTHALQVAPPIRSNVNTIDWVDAATLKRVPADLMIESSEDDTVRLPAHKALLTVASPVLAERISQLQSKGPKDLPVLRLPESSHVLRVLLQLCYGSVVLTASDCANIHLISAGFAAGKYAMPRVCDAVQKVFHSHLLLTEPILAYLLAACCGSNAEARIAARNSLRIRGEYPYLPGMENVPAKIYYRLLRYRRDVKVAAQAVIDEFEKQHLKVEAVNEVASLVPTSTSDLGSESSASNSIVPALAATALELTSITVTLTAGPSKASGQTSPFAFTPIQGSGASASALPSPGYFSGCHGLKLSTRLSWNKFQELERLVKEAIDKVRRT